MNIDFPILDVIPHGSAMCLLDSIQSYADDSLRALVTIREDSKFCVNGAVPAYVGIEYMGQAIAAFAGVESRLQGKAVKIGFLVSTRKLLSNCAEFSVGEELLVNIERIAHDVEGLSVFACLISGNNIEVSANLNVYVPEDVDSYFEQIA